MTNNLPLNNTKSSGSWFSDLCFFVYFGLSVNSIEGTDLWSGMVFIPGPWEFEWPPLVAGADDKGQQGLLWDIAVIGLSA